MKRANERGQALVETLIAAPLFVLIALGAFAYAQSLRAVAKRQAWEQFLSQSPATFPLALRERAGWPRGERDAAQELERERTGSAHSPAAAGLCRAHEADAFCFNARFDILSKALPAPPPTAFNDIFSTQHRTVLRSDAPFLPDSLVPFADRAKRALASGISAIARATAPGHPAHFVPLPSEAWMQGEGFHLSRWLGTGPADGDPASLLESALGATARVSRRTQLAVCIAESADSAFIGGLWEALASSAGVETGSASGCAAAREVFSGLASTARFALRSEALSIHAREGCAGGPTDPLRADCSLKAAPQALLVALARLRISPSRATEVP